MKLTLATSVLALALIAACGGTEPDHTLPDTTGVPIPPRVNEPMTQNEATREGEPEEPLVDPDDTFGPQSEAARVVHIDRGGTLAIQGDAALDKAMAKDFTLELWLNVLTSTNKTVMRSKGLHLLMRDSRLLVHLDGFYVQGPALALDEWYHVALVVQRDRLKLYVNGSRAGDARLRENLARPVGALVFGGDRRAPLVGYLDSIRLVRGVHYKAPFTPSHAFAPADAELAYDFDGAATDPVDLTGNGRVIRLAGAVQLVAGQL